MTGSRPFLTLWINSDNVRSTPIHGRHLMRIVKLLLLLGAVILSGCATNNASYDLVETAQETAPSPAQIQPIPSGKVRIKISRSDESMYMAVKARIKINGVEVANLNRGDTYEGIFNAGEMNLLVDCWSAPGSYLLKLNAKNDTEYDMEVSPRPGSLNSGYWTGYGMSTAAPFRVMLKAVHR